MELNLEIETKLSKDQINSWLDNTGNGEIYEQMIENWKDDVQKLQGEIQIQEMLVEFFKGEMFRLIELCAKNGINPKS